MAATDSLEKYAARVLEPDKVLEAVTKAAADGFYTCRVQFDRPVPLHETNAAKKLDEILSREGFKLEWAARLVAARENSSGADVWGVDLVLTW